MKPTVFKMGGSWVWQCNNGHGGLVGDEFSENAWRDPWTACLAAASKHAMLYHNDFEPIEEYRL